ncbi:hypothetical protein JCGZ_05410 [Jatropha curcas]|uniref:Uncharacterized protein n=1 Tax=Jatropha curcas TaxID=180498 RepID=A0A067L9M7_JATCU|nr:hypothetical protein JCGZ_05410 [Jatropha curcas]
MSKDHKPHQNLPKPKEYLVSQALKQVEEDDGDQETVSNEQEECKTPTSSDHKIPVSRSCPPTPRKKRPEPQLMFLHNKRKLHENDFFEDTHRDEIDSFFRSSFELAGIEFIDESCRSTKKRRCRSC